MKTATLVNHLDAWDTDAALYRLDPPLIVNTDAHTFVIVSSQAPVEGADHDGTLIFASDVQAHVTDWGGVARTDQHTHAAALAVLGYEVPA